MESELKSSDDLERFIGQTKAAINGISDLIQGYGDDFLVQFVGLLRSQVQAVEEALPEMWHYLNGEENDCKESQITFKETFGTAIPRLWGLLEFLMVSVERINVNYLPDLIWLARDRVDDIRREYETVTLETIYLL